MKRGDIITIAAQGDYGKPRPAVVIQSDNLGETDSLLVCLVTSTLRDASVYRLNVAHGEATGLEMPSQIMADKIMAVRRTKCSAAIGNLDKTTIQALNRMLTVVIGIAD